MMKFPSAKPRVFLALSLHQINHQGLVNLSPLPLFPDLVVILTAHARFCAQHLQRYSRPGSSPFTRLIDRSPAFFF
jgi:hypothetical protein